MVRWRLKELAQPERWNPHNLAETTGLTYKTVWAIWANKTKRADLDTIGKLARAIKVEPGALLAWDDDPPVDTPTSAMPRHSTIPSSHSQRAEEVDDESTPSQDAYQEMKEYSPDLSNK